MSHGPCAAVFLSMQGSPTELQALTRRLKCLSPSRRNKRKIHTLESEIQKLSVPQRRPTGPSAADRLMLSTQTARSARKKTIKRVCSHLPSNCNDEVLFHKLFIVPKATPSDTEQPSQSGEKNCRYCTDVALRILQNKGSMVCDQCGYSVPYLDFSIGALPYGQDVEITNFTYKRSNHFDAWLSCIQGKESTIVPSEILEQVKREIKKRRISMAHATIKHVREILKALKLRKMYEHVAQITSKVTGRNCPMLSPNIEEKARYMFVAVQGPFQKHRPKERKNFLSYSYCLYKFLQLLREDHMLDSLILLKGREKLQRQDAIFKPMCAELGWKFIPST